MTWAGTAVFIGAASGCLFAAVFYGVAALNSYRRTKSRR